MVVTFFGHRDAPESIIPKIRSELINLIEKEGACTFYVGNNGQYDNMIYKILQNLKRTYTHINYYVVLAYMPKCNSDYINWQDTVFPDTVAKAIPKFAISKRNLWMIQQCDTVITYVKCSYGGAARYKSVSMSRGKRVIEIYENKYI